MNIEDLTLKQIREITSLASGLCGATPQSSTSPFIGKEVLVRTYAAGVHVGTLDKKDGQNVLLKNARRIYNWEGAFTLSALSQNGMTDGKVSIEVPMIEVEQVIEVIETTEVARKSFVKNEHE